MVNFVTSLGPWLLAILFVTVGVLWYERSKPSSKTLALVASLAALAAVGRIVFAPIPNVKPTTDMALLSGYALGAGPGFMVGAAGALVANFFFGQGPWTLWQVVAWGGIGIGGSILGKCSKLSLGRWGLAAACGVAGLVYGAIMNTSWWLVISGGNHRIETLLTYNLTALPFDISHSIGNILFCLLFGQALVQALTRYSARSKIVWEPLIHEAVHSEQSPNGVRQSLSADR